MYIRIADGVTRGMLKWGDWEGLTEKVRLELRLKGLRGPGQENTWRRAFQAERQSRGPGVTACLVCSGNSTEGGQCG